MTFISAAPTYQHLFGDVFKQLAAAFCGADVDLEKAFAQSERHITAYRRNFNRFAASIDPALARAVEGYIADCVFGGIDVTFDYYVSIMESMQPDGDVKYNDLSNVSVYKPRLAFPARPWPPVPPDA